MHDRFFLSQRMSGGDMIKIWVSMYMYILKMNNLKPFLENDVL